MTLIVEAVGAQALVEDLGRPGHAAVGVPPGGALDRAALRLGNRLLGNPEGAAGIEVLLGGLVLRASGPALICVTGAPVPLRHKATPVALGQPIAVQAGDRLSLGMPVAGLRSYVTVRGGLAVPLLYGSASSDPTARLGPPPLAIGTVLPLGPMPAIPVPRAGVETVTASVLPAEGLTAHLVLGPRAEVFTPAAVRLLTSTSWTATADGNRVGLRLAGPRLERRIVAELPSEGMVTGALQVPPSGQPIVFLADHPTTGGYPAVAVVAEDDLDGFAQLRPGEVVRFTT